MPWGGRVSRVGDGRCNPNQYVAARHHRALEPGPCGSRRLRVIRVSLTVVIRTASGMQQDHQFPSAAAESPGQFPPHSASIEPLPAAGTPAAPSRYYHKHRAPVFFQVALDQVVALPGHAFAAILEQWEGTAQPAGNGKSDGQKSSARCSCLHGIHQLRSRPR